MDDNPITIDELGKPRRRWFQFRLRTLLIGMALLSIACSYVAHEWRIVAERKAWAEFHEIIFADSNSSLPLVRRLLGDESAEIIFLEAGYPEENARRLFPEANDGWRTK